MSKVRECKKIWFLVMLFMSIIFMGKSVMADDSVEVTVTVDKDNYYSNGDYMNNISKLNGVSYDETKRELTLNNFTGDKIYIFVKDSSVKKFTLRILGNNTLSKKISGNSTLIFVNRDDRFDGQLDFSIVGDGSLTLDKVKEDGNECIDCMDTVGITYDGPTMNIKNCSTYSSDSVVGADYFTMKSGTINMDIYPHLRMVDEVETYFYGSLITTYSRIDILAGEINASYKMPENMSSQANMDLEKAVVLKSRLEKPVIKGKVNINADSRIKDKIKINYDKEIIFRIKTERKTVVNPNEIEGLKWDPDSMTLTMDGYDGEEMCIASKYYHESVKVVIKNENKIHSGSGTIVSDGMFTIDGIDITFTGDGKLILDSNVVNGSCVFGQEYWNNYNELTKDDNKENCVIDGPILNIKGFGYRGLVYFDNFIMKSGKLIMNNGSSSGFEEINEERKSVSYFSYAILVSNSVEITGGTIVIKDKYDFPDKWSEVIYYYPAISTRNIENANNVINVKDCVIAFVDYKNGIKGKEFGYSYIVDEDDSYEYIQKDLSNKNVFLLYATDYQYLDTVDINSFSLNGLNKEYLYTGKDIKPNVKVGGLVEGEDYIVRYKNNKNLGKASIVITGIGLYRGTIVKSFEIVKKLSTDSDVNKNDNSNGRANANTYKDKKYVYRILKKANAKKYGKVEIIGLRKKNIKTVKIQSVIKIKGKKYKVVSIGKKAFANNKKIKKVVIGKYVSKIKSKAFFGCSSIKNIVINSKNIKSIAKKSFGKVKNVKVTIKKGAKHEKILRKLIKKVSFKYV